MEVDAQLKEKSTYTTLYNTVFLKYNTAYLSEVNISNQKSPN